MQHYCLPQSEPRSHVGDILRRGRAQLLEEQRFDIPGPNAPGRQFVAVPRLGQIRLASQPDRRLLDCLFERQVLERMQRVVVNEDADRPLRGEQVRKPIVFAQQLIVRCADLGGHQAT
jgi:hypothetical protein